MRLDTRLSVSWQRISWAILGLAVSLFFVLSFIFDLWPLSLTAAYFKRVIAGSETDLPEVALLNELIFSAMIFLGWYVALSFIYFLIYALRRNYLLKHYRASLAENYGMQDLGPYSGKKPGIAP